MKREKMKKITILLTCLTFFGYGANAAEYVLNETAFCSANLDYEKALWITDFTCEDENDDLINGQITEYFDNGMPKEMFFVRNGKKHGIYLHYYDTGQIRSKTNWEKGYLEGVYETYYRNGNVEQTATFSNDRLNGIAKGYNENADIMRVEFYENGIKTEILMCDNKLTRGCLKLLEEHHLLDLESLKTTHILASRSARVVGIMLDGVIVEERGGTPKKWFLYTDKKYATDDYISSHAYYEYVGTYEYEKNGELNRLHAFKERM